ncbi:MAG: prepilin-type N-terminal cleavage/methylation domain-containing protein [Patescibacteria group bacterium]
MSPRALKDNQKGFTIIEVMIVLTIAGLIMLIVFLAVPALQRNSRNTQRRSDAARFSSIVSEYVVNNNGRVPASIISSGTPAATELSIQNEDFSYFEETSFSHAGAAPSPTGGCTEAQDDAGDPIPNSCEVQAVIDATASTFTPIDTIAIVTGYTCDNNTLLTSGARSYAIIFSVENSGGGDTGVAQCV